MPIVKIYRVGRCKECDHVRMILDELGIEYEELDVTKDPYREEVVKATGCFSVPQILVEDRYIGNYHKILKLHRENRLKEALG
jgi:glutaredoxin 3